MTYKKKDRKQQGKYDWNGKCLPSPVLNSSFNKISNPNKTFSVGLFRWESKPVNKLKPGPTIFRIQGSPLCPETVYRMADEWCDKMDKGEMPVRGMMYVQNL